MTLICPNFSPFLYLTLILLSATFVDAKSKGHQKQPRVAIIGAGIAGLATANRFLGRNFSNFVVFEALERAGGRVHGVPYKHGFLQMAAQFINGDKNPLFDLADRLGVVREPFPDFGHFSDAVIRFGDCPVPEKDVQAFREFVEPLDANYHHVAFTDEQRSYDETVKSMYDKDFARFIQNQNATHGFRRHVFDSLTRPFRSYFEFEYAAKWEELSLRAISEWDDLGDVGVSYTTSEVGYTAIIQHLRDQIPASQLLFGHRVVHIDYSGPRTKLLLADGTEHPEQFNFVIVTVALGHLKRFAHRLFAPPLPRRKLEAIDKIAMGSSSKVFFEFNSTWPDEFLIPLPVPGCHGRTRVDEIEAEITTFQRVPWAPNVLMAWVAGHGPGKLERLTDEQLSRTATRLLRDVYRDEQLAPPVAIYRATWTQNDLFGGSYSHVSFRQAQARIHHADMSLPVFRDGRLRVQFAGEATHHRIFQTAVGAFLSGRREADRVLEAMHY